MSKAYDVSLSWRKNNLPVMLKYKWLELQGSATQVFRSFGNDPALALWSWFWWLIDNLGDQTLFLKWCLCEFGLLETWDLATYRSMDTHGIARDQSTWAFCQRDLHSSPICQWLAVWRRAFYLMSVSLDCLSHKTLTTTISISLRFGEEKNKIIHVKYSVQHSINVSTKY